METFINELKNWLLEQVKLVMGSLVVPIGAAILVAAAIACFIAGVIKLQGQQDDFKKYFIAFLVCIGGAVLLASLWVWGMAAAGV